MKLEPIEPTDGVLQLKSGIAIIRPGVGWISEPDELAELIRAAVPYPDNNRIYTLSYEPSPAGAALQEAHRIFGGEIVQTPKVTRDEGVIY